jgi:hypothetical protein
VWGCDAARGDRYIGFEADPQQFANLAVHLHNASRYPEAWWATPCLSLLPVAVRAVMMMMMRRRMMMMMMMMMMVMMMMTMMRLKMMRIISTWRCICTTRRATPAPGRPRPASPSCPWRYDDDGGRLGGG